MPACWKEGLAGHGFSRAERRSKPDGALALRTSLDRMTVTFLILAAITVAGTAAAMGLRNLVHCALGADRRLRRPRRPLSATRRAVRRLHADPGLRRRGRHPGRLRHPADARSRRPTASHLLASLAHRAAVIAAAVFAVLALGRPLGSSRIGLPSRSPPQPPVYRRSRSAMR